MSDESHADDADGLAEAGTAPRRDRVAGAVERADTRAAKEVERRREADVVWAEVEAGRQLLERRTDALRAQRLARDASPTSDRPEADRSPTARAGSRIMTHRFKVGQRVRLGPSVSGPAGLVEVLRLMPGDRGGEPSYRVRSTMGERAVRESELKGLDQP